MHNNHIFLETTLDKWDDIFKLNPQFLAQFIFRGQANKEWKLSTSLERLINELYSNLVDKSIISSQERDMIKDFKWKYPLYSNKNIDSLDYVEWLTVMQHYGCATRLLDFSSSLLVALYMAVFHNGNDSAVWALNTVPINSQVFTIYREKNNFDFAGRDIINLFSIELANNDISKSFNPNIKPQLYILEPKNCNERISRQQGLFVVPSKIDLPFNDCLFPYLNSPNPISIEFGDLIDYSQKESIQEEITMIKIIIPKENNFLITKHLRAMNLTAEILFPGLEGLAKSMNYGRSRIGQKDK